MELLCSCIFKNGPMEALGIWIRLTLNVFTMMQKCYHEPNIVGNRDVVKKLEIKCKLYTYFLNFFFSL